MIAGQSYVKTFFVSDTTGAAVDADASPAIAAAARRNGTLDAGFVLTVTNNATGDYKITGTVPAYTAGDRVEIVVSASVGGVALAPAIVDVFEVGPVPANLTRIHGSSAAAADLAEAATGDPDARLVKAVTLDVSVNSTPLVGARNAAVAAADKLAALTEDSGGLRLTAHALEAAPASDIDAQAVRDALKLAPSAGAAAAGSIDAQLADLGATAEAIEGNLQMVKEKTDSIGALSISYQSPFTPDGSLTIFDGADYTGTRALSMTLTGFPDMTGNTVQFRVQSSDQWAQRDVLTSVLTVNATVGGDSGNVISIPLTSTQTAALSGTPDDVQEYHYQLWYVDTTDITVLADGWMRVAKRITA